ncbi:MAG: glycosyltransferase family 39 protein [Thaumarchaeota archaeon]|nr:glycosyltransferase family 39 protein [Nitrososphaerota archaeon]
MEPHAIGARSQGTVEGKVGSAAVRFSLKTYVNPWLLTVALVLGLALLTRLYDLGSFPYFPEASPWLGAKGNYAGLFIDEAVYAQIANSFPSVLSAYQPPLQIAAVKASLLLFGNDALASRLPSALASSLTAVLVFLAAKELFNSKAAALVAGLYYVAMVPALIYGRMLFLENFAGLFVAATILSIAKFENGAGLRWLYLAAFASAIAALGKINGLFVPAFFTLWALSRQERREKLLPLLVAWIPALAGLFGLLALSGSLQGLLSQWNLGFVGRELSFQYLAIQSMPSGNVLVAGGYFKLEFWFLYGYACLAALLVLGSRAGRLLVEVLLSFLIVMLSVWGLGSYYPIMIYPVIALAAGGGSRFIAKLGTPGALAFFTGFYVPLVATYVASSSLPTFAVDYSLFFLKASLFAFPFLAWLVIGTISSGVQRSRVPFAPIILVSFFVLLVLGTTVLYPQYFLGRAP